jgi:hypothetical protein
LQRGWTIPQLKKPEKVVENPPFSQQPADASFKQHTLGIAASEETTCRARPLRIAWDIKQNKLVTLIAAFFYDFFLEKQVCIPMQGEKLERDLPEL